MEPGAPITQLLVDWSRGDQAAGNHCEDPILVSQPCYRRNLCSRLLLEDVSAPLRDLTVPASDKGRGCVHIGSNGYVNLREAWLLQAGPFAGFCRCSTSRLVVD